MEMSPTTTLIIGHREALRQGEDGGRPAACNTEVHIILNQNELPTRSGTSAGIFSLNSGSR